MGLLPRGFGRGLVVGGTVAALWWLLSNRQRRTTLVDGLMERTGAIPFPGSRLYGLMAEQMMGGVYRAVAEDVTSEARSGDLLEIGGGPGQLAVEIGRRARDLQITAMDSSSDMVRMAETRIHASGLGRQVKVAHGDAKDIPSLNDSFDFVLSLGSLHRWRAPDLVLDEIHRVLKPGGKAWIYDVRREMPESDWDDLCRRVPALVRPFFEMGVMGSWRAAYTEGQIRDVVASSSFSQFSIDEMTVEMVGTRMPALTKTTLHRV